MSIHKASQILYSRVSQPSYSLSFYAQLRPDSKMQTSSKRRYGQVHVWAPIYLRMTHCQVRRDATRHGPARHHHHRCPCLLPALRSSRLSTASRALRDYGKVNSVENESHLARERGQHKNHDAADWESLLPEDKVSRTPMAQLSRAPG